MKEFIDKLIGRLDKITELIRPVGWSRKIEVVETKAVIEIANELAEEYKDINIITDFLQYVRDNAENYDADNGWDLSDLIDLSIKFCDAEEQKGGWIACSERLPDSGVDVNITTRSSIVGVGSFFEKTNEWVQWYCGGCIVVDVIAWQPLPAPYRPKGE